MNLIVKPGTALRGSLAEELPGDKSISHRDALFAALAEGTSRIENFQVSGVTRPMLQALTSLGVNWKLEGQTLTVIGHGMASLKNPSFPMDCGNSATTLRLLAGAVAGAGIRATLDGTPGLRRRPMDRIVDPLRQMGVEIEPSEGCTAPLSIRSRFAGQKLHPLNYELPVASAQVKSCLMLAALGAEGQTVLSEPGPSRDHTERMLSSMGVLVVSSNLGARHVVEITPPDPLILSPLNLSLPADPSAAAFLIVAALITPGSSLELKGLCFNPTRTGLLEVLLNMGGNISIQNKSLSAGEPVGDVRVNHSALHGTEISGDLVVRMIDEFPILAVAAAVAEGVTLVRDARELRHKESDRIAMLAAELRLLGVKIEEHEDGFAIQGGAISGGTVQSHGDHRLAMSLAVAGLVAKSAVCVKDAQCTTESFPGYVDVMNKLGTDFKGEVKQP